MAVRKEGYKWPEKLDIISWIPVGVDIAHSWADLLEADTGMKMHIAGEYDTVDRYRWLGRMKLFDITSSGNFETGQAMMAERKYAVRDGGPFRMRTIWTASKGNSGFFLRGDTKIKTPRDIKAGTKIARLGTVQTERYDGLLAWAEVKPEDIVWVDVKDIKENARVIADGKADLAFSYPTSLVVIEAEKNPHGLRWLDMNADADPEGARRFRQIDPQVTFGPFYSGVQSGERVASGGGIWGITGINFEQTRADVDPSLVYNLAKWFDNNYERFKDKHAFNRFRNRETLIEGLRHTFLPCHEGLIEYLKDIGVWTKAHDIRQKENQELIDRYAAAYQQCMWEADEKKIWVARENDDWIKLWDDYRKANLQEFVPFEDLPKV
ncbi:MAG: TAXI family TRAP transporter solute-binding subunit [Dehalococcoidales bacterium]|jgi:hypothetical protein